MIFGIGGKLSSGKTVTAVRFAYDEGKKGKKVISNISLKFPRRIKTVYMSNPDILRYIKKNAENPEGLRKLFYNSVLLLDEVTNLFNARRSGSDINELTTNFIMYCGKLDCDVVFTYQVRSSQVDKRLREISNLYGNCYRITPDGKPVLFGNRIIESKIYIAVVILLSLDLLGSTIIKEVFDPAPYFKLYDTREINLMDREKYKKLTKKG